MLVLRGPSFLLSMSVCAEAQVGVTWFLRDHWSHLIPAFAFISFPDASLACPVAGWRSSGGWSGTWKLWLSGGCFVVPSSTLVLRFDGPTVLLFSVAAPEARNIRLNTVHSHLNIEI